MNFGSKIENLIKMQSAGLPVPDFRVLPFDSLVKTPEELHREINRVAALTPAEQSRRLREKAGELVSADVNVPDENCAYAVRSSSSVEDSSAHSFAGQFDTYLNVSVCDIPGRVKDCVRSLFNENVIDYMCENGMDLHALKMNVLVQKMVDADVSGVLFTANPQGILNESVIIAGRGLGENVVADRIDTTAYYYNTTDKVYYYEGREDLLGRGTVNELISLSEKICSLFGQYIDIEFAVKDGECFILQARPITTLSDEHPLIFDNSNIVESYPGLSLPLTVSFVKDVYEGVFESAGRRLLKNAEELNRLRPVFANTVGSANGRIYYKISNWYEIINYLPFHKKFMPIWQELVGVKYKEAFKSSTKISPFFRASIYYNTVKEIFSAPKNMEKLHEKFVEINSFAREQFKKDLSPKEIFELYDLIEKRILSDWGLTLLNDTYTFLFTGILKHRLKKKAGGSESAANDYISGITNIESMRPIREMVRIACEKDELSDEEYERQKAEYIADFGDRCPEELKLESPTYRTEPEMFDEKVNEYTRDRKKLLSMRDSMQTEPGKIARDPLTAFLSRRASTGILHREKSRLNRSRIFGLVREAVLRLGDVYVKEDVIDEKKDVFWLTLSELRALAEKPANMRETVIRRKKHYSMYALLPAYSRIIFSGAEFDKNHRSVNTSEFISDNDEMSGIPCSGGEVRGEAYVVSDPKTVTDINDKILITKMTDPGWVFLLAAAKGVVSEKGSLLSHTAIISRELGIPAVVNVENLLSTVRTGDIVSLNGTTGEVKILERAQKRSA
jgi:pyruvate,water dikinase